MLPSLTSMEASQYAPVPTRLDASQILASIDERPGTPTHGPGVFWPGEYGALGDGATLDTEAIQRAVDAAARSGGGTVVLTPGVYVCGGVELKSNVTLHLEAGAYLWGAERREDYVHPRGHLVFAKGAANVALRGRGTVYGNTHALMSFGTDRFPDRLVPGVWRPANTLDFDGCTDLLLEDVTVRNTPAWAVRPIRCDRVVIRGITILNGLLPNVDKVSNGDGLDIDACTRVRVSDCFIQSSDDAICLKITEPDEERVPLCRDITITNCVMHSAETAIKIGTESHGEFRNIVIQNCTVIDAAGGIGMVMRDGGLIDGVHVSNVVISQDTAERPGCAFFFRGYRRSDDTPRDGLVRNVTISDVTATSYASLCMVGPEAKVFRDIVFRNVRLNIHGTAPRPWAERVPVPNHPFGMLSTPYEIYIQDASDIRLENVSFRWDDQVNPQWTRAMRFIDVDGLRVVGFRGRQGGDASCAVASLENVRDAVFRDCELDEGSGPFIEAAGACRDILLLNNDLRHAAETLRLSDGVDRAQFEVR